MKRAWVAAPAIFLMVLSWLAAAAPPGLQVEATRGEPGERRVVSPSVGAEANLVFNGSFEQVTGAQPVGWGSAGDAAVTQTLSLDAGRSGGHSAKLECTAYSRQSPASHAMLAQVDKVFVTQGETYRFSC